MLHRVLLILVLTLPPLGVSTTQPLHRWTLRLPASTLTVGLNPHNPNSVYAQDNNNAFLVSYNRGISWQSRGTLPAAQVRQILVHPSDTTLIFSAAFFGGLLKSTDYGLTWNVVIPNYGIDGESIVLDPIHPDTMYAGNFSDGHVFRTTDRGLNWIEAGVAGNDICGIAIRPDSTNILYAGTGDGTISKSTDYGITWRLVKPQGSEEIPKIVIDNLNPLNAFASAYEGPDSATGVWKTHDGGETWTRSALHDVSIWSLALEDGDPQIVYAGTFSVPTASVFKSTDAGASWTSLNGGIPRNGNTWSLKVHPLDSSLVWLAVSGLTQPGIYQLRSSQAIITGAILDSATGDTIRNGLVINTATHDSIDLASSAGIYSFGYFDGDSTLTPTLRIEAYPYYVRSVQMGFVYDSTVTRSLRVERLPVANIAGSIRDSATSQAIHAKITVYGTSSTGPFILTDSSDAGGNFQFNGQYISQPPIVQYNSLVVEPTFPYPTKALPSFVLASSGISFHIDMNNADVLLVSADSGRFADYYQAALDSLGMSWSFWNESQRGIAPLSEGRILRKNTIIYYTGNLNLAFSPSEAESLLACINSGVNLFITGQNIAERNDSSAFVRSGLGVRFDGNLGALGGVNGIQNELFGSIVFSTIGMGGANNQTSKDRIAILDSATRECLYYNPGGTSAIVGVRRDRGTAKNIFFSFGFEGISSLSARLYVLQRILGYFDGSVTLGVEEDRGGLPTEFNLSQNYPNPFNPSTTIRFEIPRQSLVSLKIYNVLGQEIATLVNSELNAGRFQSVFDGTEYSSGVYLYHLSAGNFQQTKRLVLLK